LVTITGIMSNYPPNQYSYPPMSPPPGMPGLPVVPKGPREYSIFGAMVRAAFFHAGVYRDVARNWNGIGFWYLFLLLLITWAAFVRNDFPTVVADLPPITINKGHVTSPVEQPYFIKDKKSGKTMAVIDTTGTINTMDDTDAVVLITDHKIWSRQSNNNEIKQYDLSKVNYFYLDKAKLIGWMDTLSHCLAIGLLPIVLIGELIFRLIQVLIYGAINLAFGSMFGANLTYAAAMRLAVVSVTPIIFIDTVLWAGGWSIPFWTLLGIGISLLYMAMAVRANANANPPPTSGFPVILPASPQRM
jgi:energy-coupling factor transporter transmembrane protein EcfT